MTIQKPYVRVILGLEAF